MEEKTGSITVLETRSMARRETDRREAQRQDAERRAAIAARNAALQVEQDRIRDIIASIEDPKVRELVSSLEDALGAAIGSADGYLPDIGAPRTRRLQRALSAFGVTPDYGHAYGLGHRSK